MSYKFFKISSFYKEAVQLIYDRNPELINDSYIAQHDKIMRFEFGWSDHHSKFLRQLGIDLVDVIAGVEVLTNTWKKENDFIGTNDEALLKQIIDTAPEVVFFQNPVLLKSSDLDIIRNKTKNLKLMIGFQCSPVGKDKIEQLKKYDFILTCTPGFVEYFSSLGIKSFLLPHAFEPTIIEKCPIMPFEKRPIDFIFSGSVFALDGFHEERIKLLKSIIDQGINIEILAETNLLGLGLKKNIKENLIAFSKVFPQVKNILPSSLNTKIDIWDNLILPLPISNRSKPPAYGIDMFKAFSNSKIVFNAHAEVAGEWAGNVRLFEATGMGSCLVTDHKKNIKDYFEPDYEIVTYNSTEECIEKVKWLLSNPKKAEEIALRGQKRCHEDHNYQKRSELLNQIILENF
jgi:spore maturation protein CgeB